MANQRSYVDEYQIDLSQVIQDTALTVGAAVVRSRRGKLEPVLVSNNSDLLISHGKPDPAYGITMTTLLIGIRQAAATYVMRAIGDGYAYSGCVLAYVPSSKTTKLIRSVELGSVPTDFDFETFADEWETDNSEVIEPLLLVYSVSPGAFANTEMAVSLLSQNIVTPSNVVLTKTTGGTLVAGTYSYRVSARNQNGVTLASTAVTVELSGEDITAGLNAVSIKYDKVDGAAGYHIYGRLAGTELSIGTTSSTTFVDLGTVVPAGELPTSTSYTKDNVYTLKVYDDVQSKTLAAQTSDFTLYPYVDGFNVNLDAEGLNLSSAPYINVVNNVSAFYADLTALPALTSVAKTYLGGGLDGAAPTSAQASLAWSEFANRNKLAVNLLLDTGWNTVDVAQAMSAIADKQKGHGCISVPMNKQASVDAIEYRSSLSLNTRRMSLYTPWIKISDSYNGRVVDIPPAAFAFDRILYTDKIQGAARSPAGLNRGVIDALDLSSKNYYYEEESEMEFLARAQVNYFAVKRGIGVYLKEQHTLQAQFSAASFISVSRIWDILQLAMIEYSEFQLQDPNDDFKVEQIRTALQDYLDGQVIAGNIGRAIVFTDSRAGNTADVISSGRRYIDVYIEPVLPINAIRLRSILTKQGVSFEELAVQLNAA